MCMAWACLNRPTRECIAVAKYKGIQGHTSISTPQTHTTSLETTP